MRATLLVLLQPKVTALSLQIVRNILSRASMVEITALSSKLDTKLLDILADVNILALSRISISRLANTALPNIGTIELVSGDGFSRHYDSLYLSMFKSAERERSEYIVDRLHKEFANQRTNLAPYHIVGLKDHEGLAIGAAQFSVLLLKGNNSAVPYLQYIYIRSENRRQYMADVLHTMILAVATADAEKSGRVVPFTLFETNPPMLSKAQQDSSAAIQTAEIHAKAGAIALMLRDLSSGKQVSPHVQPGLEVDDPPLSIIWAIRPSPAVNLDFDVQKTAVSLMAAYYQSLRDEGFPEKNIQLAERLVAQRCQNCSFELIPIHEVVATAHHPTP